jgi:YfiH family protein
MLLTAPDLETLPSVTHGFFTRKGGVSSGLYASLNCGLGSSDVKANVVQNRERVANELGTIPEKLCSLYQVHGSKVVTVTEPWARDALPQADAMVTATPGIALGILAADCVPVLFADAKGTVVGAAHAGWKGAFAGVLQETVKAMEALGASADSIHAAIGPAIAQPSYEVSTVFHQAFIDKDPDYERYFISAKQDGHYRFDLKGVVRDILLKAGLSHINLLENDTYLEEDNFFSFRRTTHRGEPDYGRHISAIMLKS